MPRTIKIINVHPSWDMQPMDLPSPRATTRGTGAPPDFLDYLAAAEPLQLVSRQLAHSPATRRAGNPPPLTFTIAAPSADLHFVAARHPSGAITFHLPTSVAPVAAPTRNDSRKKKSATAATAQFIIPAKTAAGEISNDPELRRGFLSSVVKLAIFKVNELVGKPVVSFLAGKLEKELWDHDGRSEGWGILSDTAIAQARMQPDIPSFAADQRGLLFLHGTFSHTFAAFPEFFTSHDFASLRARYHDRIYGFDHFTISKSPADNVRDLLAPLNGNRLTWDVITHSRGGLVLRQLAAQAPNMSIGRVVLVASPNQGTPLATPGRWDQTLGWFANLMELFPENPFTTASAWIAHGVSWLVQGLINDLPGISSMDKDGKVIADLESKTFPADWYALASNYHAPSDNIAARLTDMGIDTFFGSANDLVVPTEGGWQLGKTNAADIPADDIGCFGQGGNLPPSSISHINFFAQPETRQLILNALSSQPLGLPQITPTSLLPRRALLQPNKTPAAVAVVSTATARAGANGASAVSTAVVIAPPAGSAPAATDGWNEEEMLYVTILPTNVPADPTAKTPDETFLLATYGSARVVRRFALRGSDAGRRWFDVIRHQTGLERYMNDGIGSPPSPQTLIDYGSNLFDVLFGDEVRRLYDQARYRNRYRRLTVIFTSGIAWVADLPWELAYDKGCNAFLSTSDVRFVRNSLTSVAADNIVATTGPLRILLICPQPIDVPSLSVAAEHEGVLESFRPLIDAGAVVVEVLSKPTVENMHAWVRQRQFDVVHFIGHGDFEPNESGGTGNLLFEDDNRRSRKLPATDLKNILRSRGIRLVFLNACQSGQGGHANYNQGVAPSLVSDGVPAVVANQYSVFDRAAMLFAKHFYWCLAQGLSLGDAAREARIAMNYSGLGALAWAVPVLFARNPNAALCTNIIRSDVPPTPPPPGLTTSPPPTPGAPSGTPTPPPPSTPPASPTPTRSKPRPKKPRSAAKPIMPTRAAATAPNPKRPKRKT
jgi:hypothetical protein